MNASKRELDEAPQPEPKRPKVSSVSAPDTPLTELASSDGDVDESTTKNAADAADADAPADAEATSPSTAAAPASESPLSGPGPHTVLIWAEALHALLGDGSDIDAPFVTLKASALDVWQRVRDVPADERFDVVQEVGGRAKRWYVSVEDGHEERKAALLELWEERKKKDTQEGGEGGEDAEGAEDDDKAWWNEVTLQKDDPGDDTPAVKVDLEEEGTFWITDIAPAGEDVSKAMSLLADYFA